METFCLTDTFRSADRKYKIIQSKQRKFFNSSCGITVKLNGSLTSTTLKLTQKLFFQRFCYKINFQYIYLIKSNKKLQNKEL
jgi:hypothetical protein